MKKKIQEILSEGSSILVLDGAMGTMIQRENLNFDGPNEILNLEQSEIIKKIHKLYLSAGADIVETNSFGANFLGLSEFGLEQKVYEINRAAAKNAREAVAEFGKGFVAGSVGPMTIALSINCDKSFDQISEHYYEQIKGLWEGGVDYILLETFHDLLNLKAALLAHKRLSLEKGEHLPVAVSCTIEKNGCLLSGPDIPSLCIALENHDLMYLGLNCSMGLDEMVPLLKRMREFSSFKLSALPNAGLPDETGGYKDDPEQMAKIFEELINDGIVDVIGGCCGTNPEHIALFAKLAHAHKPMGTPAIVSHLRLSQFESLELEDAGRPYLVGERTNVIGSKLFREMIKDERFEEAADIAKLQVAKGAHVIDACLANPERDELQDMKSFLKQLSLKIKVPIMIDSINPIVVEEALKLIQGKAIINSINLEEGEERFLRIARLAKNYGASLVVGLIDEIDGMAVKLDKKIKVAERSYRLLQETGIAEQDIIWDTLTFPCGNPDPAYRGAAQDTIQGIVEIKKRFPCSHFTLGVSNISFGLPANGREVLNSVFLYHCVKAGLSLAIVNTQKLKRFNLLSQKEIELSDNLLFDREPNALIEFSEFFKGQVEEIASAITEDLPPLEALQNMVLSGTVLNLKDVISRALLEHDPLDVIEKGVLSGMSQVGSLFKDGKLIVAEVLQSAEVVKKSMDLLTPHLGEKKIAKKKVLLATVKGDVHDIGKNLVGVIFQNNGYEVVDIGIKVETQALLDAIALHKPDVIGLSGLLVKSAYNMIDMLKELQKVEVNLPILIGGAAISRAFVEKNLIPIYLQGKVLYAKDAMDGLHLLNGL